MRRCRISAFFIVAISALACHGNRIVSEYEAAVAGGEQPWHWPWDHDHHVAFTAVLTAGKEVKANEKIVFDKTELNDGDHYDTDTGVFRVPHDGVYLFTFVVYQKGKEEIRVNLEVDDKIVVGAVADGQHTGHEVQGTNTAILHLHEGNKVYIEAVHDGRLGGEDENPNLATFSGHILYCLD